MLGRPWCISCGNFVRRTVCCRLAGGSSRQAASSSTRRQEVDRVEDLGGRRAFLLAEVELEYALDDIRRQRGGVQVGRLHPARGNTTVRLDGQRQHHLAAQARIDAQLAVVDAIERRLVTVEDDLDLFVGTRRASALGQRAVSIAHAVAAAASAAAAAIATAASTDAEVGNATAAAVGLGDDERAGTRRATGVLPTGIGNLRVRPQFGWHVVVQQLREVVLESQHPRALGLRTRLLDLGCGRGRGLDGRFHRFRLDLVLRFLLVRFLLVRLLVVLFPDLLLRRLGWRLGLHHLDETIRHFDRHIFLDRWQFPEHRSAAEGERKQQSNEKTLAEALGILTLRIPWHGHGSIGKIADLALDQELRFLPVFLFERLGEVVLQILDAQQFVLDTRIQRIAALLDGSKLFVELRRLGTCTVDAILYLLVRGLLAPEQLARVERIQLVQRLAYLGQKLILLLVLGQPVQLALTPPHLVLKT